MVKRKSGNSLLKFGLYQLPFWFAYHFIWFTIFTGSLSFVINEVFYSERAVKFYFYPVFHAAGASIILYYLIPKYLERGKHVRFTWSVIAVIILASTCIAFGYHLSVWLAGKRFLDLYQQDPYIVHMHTLSSTTASMTLVMSLQFSKNWLQSQRREKLIESEKLQTELSYLRSQMNPHFIFNTINSIFFLINKSPEKASSSLAKFSRMLRYQLYECNDLFIPLSKEITYIENFIALERLRQNENTAIDLSIDDNYSREEKIIAPFILITFIENAFKHVLKERNKPSWIRIALTGKDMNLELTVSNSVSSFKVATENAYGGIGLKNVKRRLDLLYPGRHELTINQNDKYYEAKLKLVLSPLHIENGTLKKSDEEIMIANKGDEIVWIVNDEPAT